MSTLANRDTRSGASGLAAVLLAILLGAGVAVWQARVALAEKARAEEVKEFIASIFRDANPYEGQGNLSAADLLKQAKGRIDRLSDRRPGLRGELLTLVGDRLLGIGDSGAAEGIARQAAKEASAPTPMLPMRLFLVAMAVSIPRGRPSPATPVTLMSSSWNL